MKTRNLSRCIGVAFLFLLACRVSAAIDVYEFGSDDDRHQFQGLINELRCPKCQNQNLTDSNSAIAIDLREQVARLVKEGKSDKEVKTYMVDRYGDFVLYKPPVQSNTIVLWVAPAVLGGIAAIVFLLILISRRRNAAASDTQETDNDIAVDSGLADDLDAIDRQFTPDVSLPEAEMPPQNSSSPAQDHDNGDNH